MAENFYTILTNIGMAAIANAQVSQSKVDFASIAVGDSNGSYYNPAASATKLVNEVWRGSINAISIDETNPNWIIVEAVIPATIGGFSVREIGVFDTSGSLLAIGKIPETYKPAAEQGSLKDLYLRIILEVSNASSVTLKVDPAVIYASKKYVDDKVGIVVSSLENTQQQLENHEIDYVKHPGVGINGIDGSANKLTLTLTVAPTAYKDNMGVLITPQTNTTAAATLNVNGLGYKSILKANGSAVTNLKLGVIYTLRYSANKGAFILQGEGGEYGNATEIDVAKGKTFGTENGLKTGTATISKLPPFMPNDYKYYTSGELRAWNHLSAPVFATKGLFGITATNTPDNVYATKVYRLNANGTVTILWDSNTQTWISATTFRSVWHHDMSYTFYQSDFNLGLNIWFVQTSSQLSGSVTTAKPLAGGISGIMHDGFMYTIERQSGITYLHKMNPPYAVNQGGIVQSFSVPLDAYNTNINLPYVWRVQLIDGYVLFIRTDYKEVRLYDLTLTLVKTITVDYGTGQEAILMSYDTIRNLLSSVIVYDRVTGAFGFKNTGLQTDYANVHSYPYNWITSNG